MRILFVLSIFLYISNAFSEPSDDHMIQAGSNERLLICKKANFPLNDCYVGKIDILGDQRPEYVVMSDDFVAVFSTTGKDIRHDKLDAVAGLLLREKKRCQEPACAVTIKAQRIPSFAPNVYDLVIQTPRGCGVISQQEYGENHKPNGKQTWASIELMDCNQSIQQFIMKRASCRAVGSTWWIRDSSGQGSCDWPTEDGGKPCTDNTQCQEACLLLSRQASPKGDISGECSRSTYVGCRPQIVGGRIRRPPCP